MRQNAVRHLAVAKRNVGKFASPTPVGLLYGVCEPILVSDEYAMHLILDHETDSFGVR